MSHEVAPGQELIHSGRRYPAGALAPAGCDVATLSALGVLFVIVVSLALLIARALARSLSRPLEALAVSSNRIAQLDFTPPPPLPPHTRAASGCGVYQDALGGKLVSANVFPAR